MKLVWARLRGTSWTVHAIGIAGFTAFLACFFTFMNWFFPEVGHDYHFFFSELLEGKWEYYHFGLAVPRYAPHLCGGSVLYGNPQDMYYSLAQLLVLWLGPWLGIQLTILASLVAGYVGWYRVGRDLVGLPQHWAHVLALVVIANGFYFTHLAVGHLSFHAFALLGWFFLLLFDRRPSLTRSSEIVRAAVFALLCAYVLYSGNWIVLLYLAIGFCLVLPLDLFLAEHWTKRLLQLGLRVAILGLAAFAIMSSKLVAIYSFMRSFPREIPLISQDPDFSTVWFMIKSFWGLPQNAHLLSTMAPGFVHEKSVLISPVILLGLLLGCGLLLARIRKSTGRQRSALLVFSIAYGGVLLVTMIQLVRGYGFIAELFHRLPIGASQRVSSRYLYLLSLLLSVAGVWAVAKTTERLSKRTNIVAMLVAGLITVTTFAFGYLGPLPELGFWPNANDHRENWRRFDPSVPVTRVVEGTDLLAGTGRTCYEPILNSAGDPFSVLHVGSVADQDHGYFNLMNPACYQYPRENHCRPGDRISVGDADNLARFTRGSPVTWKTSLAQEIADVVSILSLFCSLIVLRYSSLFSTHGSAKPGLPSTRPR